MNNISRRNVLAGTALLGASGAWTKESAKRAAPDFSALDRNPAIPIIDAHSHYEGEHPGVLQWMADNNVKLLDIAVAGQDESWRSRAEGYRRLAKQHPDQYGWCTGFTLPDFSAPDFSAAPYTARVLRQLEKDFADNAVACKLWKSVGMSIQRPNGRFLQMDDPIFDPVYDWLASHGHTLLVHMADPMACWQPLNENNMHRQYYEKHPEWHMYGRTDRPHHSEILAARDRVIERYPALRVVGAHLGSLEQAIDELARRFDRYPNFAVDTSGNSRIADLGHQDRENVRAFFIKYQDRLMFGTDRSTQGQLKMNPRELEQSLAVLQSALQTGWDYYATDKMVSVNKSPCQGLALPEGVLKKLFCRNAQQWYPGL
jgi:hypothetical protein